mgnify:CR=1 FL=1
MSKVKSVLKVMFEFIVLVLLLGVIVSSYFVYDLFASSPMCGVEIVDEVYSNNKEVKAVLFQFDCGAMDAFSTQVSVLSAADELHIESGNVFSAKHGEYRGEWGGPYAEIRWVSDNELLISYAEDTEVFQSQAGIGAVTVTYKRIPVNANDIVKHTEPTH